MFVLPRVSRKDCGLGLRTYYRMSILCVQDKKGVDLLCRVDMIGSVGFLQPLVLIYIGAEPSTDDLTR